MNWLDRVKNPVHFISEAGSQYKTIYAPVVNKDGTIELKEKEILTLYHNIKHLSKCLWHISNITIESLTTHKSCSITHLITLNKDINIAAVLE